VRGKKKIKEKGKDSPGKENRVTIWGGAEVQRVSLSVKKSEGEKESEKKKQSTLRSKRKDLNSSYSGGSWGGKRLGPFIGENVTKKRGASLRGTALKREKRERENKKNMQNARWKAPTNLGKGVEKGGPKTAEKTSLPLKGEKEIKGVDPRGKTLRCNISGWGIFS